jgi:hypothetical protein
MPVLQLHRKRRLRWRLIWQRLPLGIQGLCDHPRIGIPLERINKSRHLGPRLHLLGIPILITWRISPGRAFLQIFVRHSWCVFATSGSNREGMGLREVATTRVLSLCIEVRPSGQTSLTLPFDTQSRHATLLTAWRRRLPCPCSP